MSSDNRSSNEDQDLSDSLSNRNESAEYVSADAKPGPNKGLLAVLAVAALGAAAYFLVFKGEPAPAAAAGNAGVSAGPGATGAAPEAQATIQKFLSGGGTSLQSMVRNTDRIVQSFRRYPTLAQVPLPDLRANPFQHDAAVDPTAKPATQPTEELAARARERERAAVRAAAQRLNLQTVIARGSRPSALVNDTLLHVGDPIDQFTVEAIEPDGVILRAASGQRFKLAIQH